MEHSPAFSFNSSHKGNPCSQVNDFGHPLKDSPHPLTRLTSAWTPGTLSKRAGRQALLLLPPTLKGTIVRLLFEKKKSLQHLVFPGGLPSKYYPGPTLLSFRDRTRSGVLSVVWP